MDNLRRARPVPTGTRQTIDGFITAPRVNGQRVVGRTALQAPSISVPPIRQERRLTDATPRSFGQAAQLTAGAQMPSRQLPVLNLDLPAGAPPHSFGRQPHSRWHSFRTWSFRTAAIALILVIGLGGLLFGQGYLKLHKIFKGGASAAALKADVDPSLLKGEGDGRINVLLLGIGGGEHEAPDLTDTIMLASIDPVNHTASLLSIPRDLSITIPNSGSMNINAAYETGKYKYLGRQSSSNKNTHSIQAGFAMADQTIEQVVGVPIHYNVLLDFQAFRQAIDTVGGVTVNVPTTLNDPTMAWENHGNPVLAKAGLQGFDGKSALMYVRSRETSSDFARAERQRAVLLALKDKMTTLGTLSNPSKLSGLIGAFGDNVQTDLSLNDATRLYSISKDIGNSRVQSFGLTDSQGSLITTGDINGQSVVQPKAGLSNYAAIQNYVRSMLKDGYITKENARITLLNGTPQAGLATSKATDLKSYGYNVQTVANAPSNGYTQTVVVDLTHGKDKYTKHYLEQRFNTTATTQLPDASIQATGADFIIVLGSDETFSSQN